jgi:hypothetical protein
VNHLRFVEMREPPVVRRTVRKASSVVGLIVVGVLAGIALAGRYWATQDEGRGSSSPYPNVVPSPTPTAPPDEGPVFPDVFGRVVAFRGDGYRVEEVGDSKFVGPATLVLDDGTEIFLPAGTPVNALCRDLAVVSAQELGPCVIQATLAEDDRTVDRLYVFVGSRDETHPKGFFAFSAKIAAVLPGFIVLPERTAIPLAEAPLILCQGIDDPAQLPDHHPAGFRLRIDERTGEVVEIECSYFL